MSDVVFYEMISHVDEFSFAQKKSLMKALRQSLAPRSFFAKKHRVDRKLTESLIGAGGNADVSVEQIKAERLGCL